MTKENDLQKDERRHSWQRPPQDNKLKLRNTLNIIFMVLAIASVILYFALPRPDGLPYFFVCCFLAIIIKGIEVCIRMVSNKNGKR